MRVCVCVCVCVFPCHHYVLLTGCGCNPMRFMELPAPAYLWLVQLLRLSHACLCVHVCVCVYVLVCVRVCMCMCETLSWYQAKKMSRQEVYQEVSASGYRL